MPRRFLRNVLPSQANLKKRWFLRPFSALLHDPALWATHRRNVLRALALGIFISFIPFPVHTAMAAIVALYLRVNLAVAVLASWLSNPVTFGPMYYGAYRLGVAMLGSSPAAARTDFSIGDMTGLFLNVWQPLLLGCLVAGSTLALVAYWVLNRLWIRQVHRRLRLRRERSGTGAQD